MVKVEKRPGWDWEITYLDEDENGNDVESFSVVFGAMSVDDALSDFRYSFSADDRPYVVSIVRFKSVAEFVKIVEEE